VCVCVYVRAGVRSKIINQQMRVFAIVTDVHEGLIAHIFGRQCRVILCVNAKYQPMKLNNG